MDTKAYIESGILEDYVAELVSPQERQEVECLSKIYPEINEYLIALQRNAEEWASAYAVSPPDGLKQKIMDQIAQEPQESADKDGSVIEMKPDRQPKENAGAAKSQKRNVQILAAASIVILIISGVLLYQMNNQFSETRENLTELRNQYNEQQQEFQKLNQQYQNVAQNLKVATDPSYKRIDLNSVKPDLSAKALVYWNPEQQNVFLETSQLPETPSDKQYQLWAIVDEKPVDLGVVDKGQLSASKLAEMKKAGKASAFAITLEPKGGSKTPTMDQMYVMGKATS